jgi:putative peptide zinc metalloprotease protein
MILSPPKFRSDLKIIRQQNNCGTFYIVKNPGSNEFFRLRETEEFIAHQFDGKTPLDVVRQRAEAKFEATLPPEALDAFVKNLEKTGLLETEEAAGNKTGNHRRIAGSFLYLRFKLLDPAQLFDRLISIVQFCFTPWFVAFSAISILIAVATLASNWNEYAHDLHGLYHLSSIPVFVGLSFLIVSTHEFSHGLTCKHFGGEVHEIGFLLIYLQPALYCNVSDAWLLPEKSKRLWVGFAGPYFELFVWSIAVMAWRLTEAESWINYAALIVITSSGIKTLLNFNPFIKLDGYYLLSDYLEIPNLRRKSFRYVGSLIERLFGRDDSPLEEFTRRERRIFLFYGLVATVSSFFFLVYVLVKAGSLLIDNGKPLAFLLTMGFLCLKLRRRLRRLFGKSSDATDPTDDGDDIGAASSPEPRAISPKTRRKGGSLKKWIGWAAGISATLAIIAFVWFGSMQLRVSGSFNVLPIDNSDARAVVEGIVDRIYVNEGDEVKKGQLIARLSDQDLRAELLKTEAEIKAGAAKLRMLEAGPTPYQVEVAKATVAKADGRLKYAQNRETRIRGLFEEHLRSRNEYEDARELSATAENELNEAKSRLNLLLSGNRPEEIEATKAEVERLETERHYLHERLRLLNVLSPASGIVATPSRVLMEMQRTLVRKGDLILKVYDFKTIAAQILIPEKDIDGVHVGERVVLRARAFPDYEFHGTVTSIATSAQGPGGVIGQSPLGTTSSSNSGGASKTILVTTEIKNPDMLLKSEMTGNAKIFCGQRRVIDLIMRRISRTLKVEFWSWW